MLQLAAEKTDKISIPDIGHHQKDPALASKSLNAWNTGNIIEILKEDTLKTRTFSRWHDNKPKYPQQDILGLSSTAWTALEQFFQSLRIGQSTSLMWSNKPSIDIQKQLEDMIKKLSVTQVNQETLLFKKLLLSFLSKQAITIIDNDVKIKHLFSEFQWCSIQDFISREIDGILQIILPQDISLKEFTASEHIKLIFRNSIQPSKKNFTILQSLFQQVKEWYYDARNHSIIVTFPSHSIATHWIGVQLPWQG